MACGQAFGILKGEIFYQTEGVFCDELQEIKLDKMNEIEGNAKGKREGKYSVL